MACFSKKTAFIVIFLCLSVFCVNSFANSSSQCIKKSLNKIEDANKNQLKGSDEKTIDKTIDKIINKKDLLLTDLFNCLKEQPGDLISTIKFSSRIRFLKARIATNRSLNNSLAVKRDLIEIDTNKIRIRLSEFLSFLIHSYNSSRDQGMIMEKTEIELSYLEKISVVETEEFPGSGRVVNEFKENILEFRALSAAYSDILNFTMENIFTLFTKSWFHYIHIDTSIDKINSLKSMGNINRIISPLGLDMGRLVLVVVILAIVSLLYPLFSRLCDIISGIVAKHTNIPDKIDIFYNKIKRPFKLLILFVGIDIALAALSYKTAGAESIAAITYCIYSLLLIYFFFNFIDALAIVQLEKYESRHLRDEFINIFIKFAKFLVFITGITFVLSHFGIKMTAILSTLGIGGLAFALAAKDTLSNLFGGITILMDDLFRQGDWIVIQEVEGTVVEVGVRSTTVRTFANALVTVPNSTIANFQVVNWSKRSIGRRIKMHIAVTYESGMQDVKNAIQDIRDMLAKHPGLSKPEKQKSFRSKHSAKLVSINDSEGIMNTQMVHFDRYNDYSMDILIYCFSKATNWAEWLQVKEDLLYKIHEILTKNNLEFAYPTEIRINRCNTQEESK